MAIGRFEKKNITIKSYLEIKEELMRKSKNKPSSFTGLKLTIEERNLIKDIKEMTNNVNNVTRTHAYFHFFLQYPEIHWAL